MCYQEDEAYVLWSKMTDNEEDRIVVMRELLGLTENEAIEYDNKFSERRNKQIWMNSHLNECAKVIL